MHKRICIVLIIICVIFFASSPVEAGPRIQRLRHADRNRDGVVDRKEWRMEKHWERSHDHRANTWWEKRADTNGDGFVDDHELNAWKNLADERIDINNDGYIDAKERRLCWRHARSRVNTALEQKYDLNSDGWLEPAEVKELLKDRYALINTDGKAKVDTAIEAEYDTNDDGIIDSEEAKALKEDLGL